MFPLRCVFKRKEWHFLNGLNFCIPMYYTPWLSAAFNSTQFMLCWLLSQLCKYDGFAVYLNTCSWSLESFCSKLGLFSIDSFLSMLFFFKIGLSICLVWLGLFADHSRLYSSSTFQSSSNNSQLSMKSLIMLIWEVMSFVRMIIIVLVDSFFGFLSCNICY